MGGQAARTGQLLVLTSSFPRWAGDTEGWFVFELSRRLAERGAVCVLAPHAPGAKTHELLDGITVIRYRYAPSSLEQLAYAGGLLSNVRRRPLLVLLVPVFLAAMLLAAWSTVRRRKIDAIHAHWIFPQGLVALLCQRLTWPRGPKVVCTAHGGDVFGLRGRFWEAVQRWVLRKSDEMAVVSSWLREVAARRSGRTDIRVMPMGVDTRDRFFPVADTARSTQRLLFVGRLVEKKGCRYLISAMPRVFERFPDAELVVAGDGPDRAMLEREVKALSLEGKIRFLGTVSQADLPGHYRGAAVFVGPSLVAASGDQEGLGLVFAEASACECPVVATRLPAIADVVVDGKTGILVEQKDSRALADAIVHLLSRPDARQKLGEAGRRHVIARFDWSEVAARYAQVLQP